jgi:ketosteroid isomerase-like protein
LLEFGDLINRRDIDAIMGMVTDDIVFETTTPPDGERSEGRDAVRKAMESFFKNSRNPRFETEEVIVSGDRGVVRWKYTWDNEDGTKGHVRGVDIDKVVNGKVAESIAYVKG